MSAVLASWTATGAQCGGSHFDDQSKRQNGARSPIVAAERATDTQFTEIDQVWRSRKPPADDISLDIEGSHKQLVIMGAAITQNTGYYCEQWPATGNGDGTRTQHAHTYTHACMQAHDEVTSINCHPGKHAVATGHDGNSSQDSSNFQATTATG